MGYIKKVLLFCIILYTNCFCFSVQIVSNGKEIQQLQLKIELAGKEVSQE